MNTMNVIGFPYSLILRPYKVNLILYINNNPVLVQVTENSTFDILFINQLYKLF